MSADATRPRRGNVLDLTPSPEIRDVAIRRIIFDPPHATWVGTRKREYDEGIAITLVTSTELPARALNPTLHVGDAVLDRVRKIDDGYEFVALDEDLEEGAAIHFQWPDGEPVETDVVFRMPRDDPKQRN